MSDVQTATPENEVSNDNLSSDVDTPTQPESTPVAENTEFDALVDEALKTNEDRKEEAKQEKLINAPLSMNQEQAGQLAITAVTMVEELAKQLSGKPVEIPEVAKMAFSTMLTPAIMKHGATIQKLMSAPTAVDLDSNIPEYLAGGAVLGTGYLIYSQVKPEKGKPRVKVKPGQETDNQAQAVA
ncbi:hypothetical protein HR060_10720 [Catenovulum sp. SM1970]|uniref:hypothetical protein n=1 Tax=Marinifaba aquimaris TaxID=2741323 RepID=UPI00157267B1|nr:hypothetical protein [Marinifaba aquimaris]NTS77337.1 hypothetical protein [Marinifaba aquimaris]